MNLLLLLSALLSALTGVGASARGVVPAATVAEQVVSPRVAAVASEVVRRPLARWSTRPAWGKISLPMPPRIPTLLILGRRRE